MNHSKQKLRKDLLLARSNISTAERLTAALQIRDFVIALPLFNTAKHIAFYMPSNHELDPLPTMQYALAQQKICYLPVISADNNKHLISASHNKHLMFARCNYDTPLKVNRFNILEPATTIGKHETTIDLDKNKPTTAINENELTTTTADKHNSIINLQQLDIIFLPLVAFDLRGYRLGMGGGFYDYTLAPLTKTINQHANKPTILGFAYSSQQVAAITVDPWDIPMDGVITEKSGLILF